MTLFFRFRLRQEGLKEFVTLLIHIYAGSIVLFVITGCGGIYGLALSLRPASREEKRRRRLARVSRCLAAERKQVA